MVCFAMQASAQDAMIVCPGGSYCWHDMKTEGGDVAAELEKRGVKAYVVKYRVSGIFAYVTHSRLLIRGNQYPDALEDVRKAFANARKELGKDARIGIVGFSAGGHLALLAAMDSVCDPCVSAAIYPVVTMQKPYVHKRSRRGLLGEYRKFSRTMRDSLSLEKHADRVRCPVFLLNCKDDPTVDWHNSVLMDSALTAADKPHLYLQFDEGGHGFGTTKHDWLDKFLNWFRRNGK